MNENISISLSNSFIPLNLSSPAKAIYVPTFLGQKRAAVYHVPWNE